MTEFFNAPFWRVAEFASVAGTSERTVTRLIENGEIEAVKIGVQWRIPRTEVERLLGKDNMRDLSQNFTLRKWNAKPEDR